MPVTDGPTWTTLPEPRSSTEAPSEEPDELTSGSPNEVLPPVLMSEAPRKRKKKSHLLTLDNEELVSLGMQPQPSASHASGSSKPLASPLNGTVKKKKKRIIDHSEKSPEPPRIPLPPLERAKRRASEFAEPLSPTQLQRPPREKVSTFGRKNKRAPILSSSDEEAVVIPKRPTPRPSGANVSQDADAPRSSSQHHSSVGNILNHPTTFSATQMTGPVSASTSRLPSSRKHIDTMSFKPRSSGLASHSQNRAASPRSERNPVTTNVTPSMTQSKRKRRRSSPVQVPQRRKSTSNVPNHIELTDDDAPLPRPRAPPPAKRRRRTSPVRAPPEIIEILDSDEDMVLHPAPKLPPSAKKSISVAKAAKQTSRVSFREDPDGTIVISDDDEDDGVMQGSILGDLLNEAAAQNTVLRTSQDVSEHDPSIPPTIEDPLPEGPPNSGDVSEEPVFPGEEIGPAYSSPVPHLAPPSQEPGDEPQSTEQAHGEDLSRRDSSPDSPREDPRPLAPHRKSSGTTAMQLQMESLVLESDGAYLSESLVPSLQLPDSSLSVAGELSASRVDENVEDDVSCLSQTAEKRLQITDGQGDEGGMALDHSEMAVTAETGVTAASVHTGQPDNPASPKEQPSAASKSVVSLNRPISASPSQVKRAVPGPLLNGSNGFFKSVYEYKARRHSPTSEMPSPTPRVASPLKHSRTAPTDMLRTDIAASTEHDGPSYTGTPVKGSDQALAEAMSPSTLTRAPSGSLAALVMPPIASPAQDLTDAADTSTSNETHQALPLSDLRSPLTQPLLQKSTSPAQRQDNEPLFVLLHQQQALTEVIASAIQANQRMYKPHSPDDEIIDLTLDEEDMDLNGTSEFSRNSNNPVHQSGREVPTEQMQPHLPMESLAPNAVVESTNELCPKPPLMKDFLHSLRAKTHVSSVPPVKDVSPVPMASSASRPADSVPVSSKFVTDVPDEQPRPPLNGEMDSRSELLDGSPSQASQAHEDANDVITTEIEEASVVEDAVHSIYEEQPESAATPPTEDVDLEDPSALVDMLDDDAGQHGPLSEDSEVSVLRPTVLPVRARSASSRMSPDDDTDAPIALRRSKRSSYISSRSSSAANLSPGPITPRDEGSVAPKVRIRRGTSSEEHAFGPENSASMGGFELLTWEKDAARMTAPEFADTFELAADLPHEIQDRLNAMHIAGRRADNMQVKIFEAVMSENTAKGEPFAPPIQIINMVDDELTPPCEFHYTNLMWHGEGVPTPDLNNLQGCDCVGPCDPNSKTCACVKRQEAYSHEATRGFLYDSRGRLRVHEYPIFECNMLCKCSDTCSNRVVQRGRKYPVTIQKTPNKGWGVFAGNKKIPANTYLGVYAGEYLTDSQGELRGMKYNKFGRTYLFDIDFYFLKGDDPDNWRNKYCIDAYHAGNFTRYLNHSCDPNCHINACFINEGNIEKPLLAIFTCRDVDPGEELCFSYFGIPDDDEEDEEAEDDPESKNANDGVYVPCRCGAKRCKGKMWK